MQEEIVKKNKHIEVLLHPKKVCERNSAIVNKTLQTFGFSRVHFTK